MVNKCKIWIKGIDESAAVIYYAAFSTLFYYKDHVGLK